MKNKSLLFFGSILTAFLAAFVITSCNKKFDEPPVYTDPGVTANTTIKQLRALSTGYGVFNEITTDIIISGQVVANDKSGNIYKEIYIQDTTAGIALQLDATGLYNSYPLGREVFVVCKGLYVANESGMIKLCVRAVINGAPSVSGIPGILIDNYVKRGKLGTPPAPKVVTIAQLNNDFQSMLIQLENYQVTSADMGKTFADTSTSKATQNINTQSCAGASSNIIVRTSGYANFAGQRLPQGNGTLTAIYTVFASNAGFNSNPTKQLIIRDTSDMKFYGSRCGQGPTTLINTADVRALYTGSAVAAPANRRITGIVISDRVGANGQAQNLVLQQGNGLAGVVVRFEAAHSFNVGDSIDVNITGATIDKFSGVTQVATLPLANAIVISSGKTITPRVTTNALINTNIDTWESTLVTLSNVTITAGVSGTWGSNGNTTITDASGTITHFTRSGATFQNTAYPTGTVTTLTAIVSRFNTTNQIGIRNLTDIVGGTGTGGGGSSTTISLGSTSPFLLNFNNIGSGLPNGVKVYTASTASALGTAATFTSALGSWANFSVGFKNFASATGLTATSDQAAQDAATNRALGVRQTSSAGYDPGASFVFEIDNTTGKTNIQLQFLLQSLDNSIGRTTTWTVDYALGDNPTTFTAATPTGTMTTSPTFGSNTINVNFGGALDNKSQKVWIRIVTLSGTTGTGNRPSTAIDDFRLSWN